jgi:uncharacterized protein (TIRG00374 family)
VGSNPTLCTLSAFMEKTREKVFQKIVLNTAAPVSNREDEMTTEAPPTISPSLKKGIAIAALLGYTVLALYLFYFIGIGELVSVIRTVNVGVYALALACVIMSLTFHTLVWFQLLNAVGIPLGFRRAYVLYWVGVFVDNLIPGGWSGDLFKAYLLNKDPAVESGKAVASVVAKNMYEAIFNLGNMVVGVVLLVLNYTFEGSLLITIGGIMLFLTMPLALLLGASFKPEGAKKLVASLFRLLSRIGKNRWHLDELQRKVEKALGDYHEGMQTLLKEPGMLFKPMVLSFFAWAFEVITLLFVFASLGQFIPFDKVLIVRSIAGNIEAQGYAFVGFANVITTQLYGALGVPFAVGASVALLGGAVVFWLRTGVSYTAFHYTMFSNKPLSFIKSTIGKNSNPKDNKSGARKQSEERHPQS